MKSLLSLLFVSFSLLAFSQHAIVEYNKVEIVRSNDTIRLDNSSVVMFTKEGFILQNDIGAINTFIVPGSEFDKLSVLVFYDTGLLLEEDSLSKTILYTSINHSIDIGLRISDEIIDSMCILKKNKEKIIFKK
jgi:hypothetical protein